MYIRDADNGTADKPESSNVGKGLDEGCAFFKMDKISNASPFRNLTNFKKVQKLENNKIVMKLHKSTEAASAINVVIFVSVMCISGINLFADLSCGAKPPHTIIKPPRAWVHHYGNRQVSRKCWNK